MTDKQCDTIVEAQQEANPFDIEHKLRSLWSDAFMQGVKATQTILWENA